MNDIAARLEGALRAGQGADLRVRNLDVMEDGHAGLTFGFELSDAAGASRGYILKMAPAGVTRRGNTDVFRQSPLLRALKTQGLPVPDVPWASADDAPLGAPFIVMERLAGRVFVVWEPHASFSRDVADLRRIWLQAADLLARVHRVDWWTVLAGWEQPRSLSDELDQWTRIISKHAEDPEWRAAGMRLGELLRAHLPDDAPVGLVHGDFQPGNILYEDGQVRGLIDWELSLIGAQGLDLGWMLMMIDPQAWHPGWRPVTAVTGAEVIEAYRASGGPALANLAWYQALAQYRLGAIACLNVKLHRSGKRLDDLWERFAPSVSYLFGRGIELAEQAGRSGARPA